LKDIKEDNYFCYIPISNIIVEKIYEFGAIRIIPYKFIEQELSSDGFDDEMIKFCLEKTEERNHFNAYIKISLSGADPQFIKENAIISVNELINILQAFKYKIFTYQGVALRSQSYITFNASKKSLSVDKKALDHNLFNKPIIFKEFSSRFPIEKVLEPNKYEKKFYNIKQALLWLGISEGVHEYYLKLLYRVIALESLFINGEQSGAKFIIAEKCAFLLETEYEKRLELFNFILDIYKLRNNIAHGSFDSTIQIFTIEKLFDIIFKSILMITFNDNIKSIEQLSQINLELKFGKKLEQ